MAAATSSSAYSSFSMLPWGSSSSSSRNKLMRKSNTFSTFSVSAQQADVEQQDMTPTIESDNTKDAAPAPSMTVPRPVEPQLNVKSKNLGKEYGGMWLSSTTRHVRIFAAYIDPVTCEFDQTQMDKLTLILDPTDEFVWTYETTTKVYSYFQELVDHYEGAPLTEYTLRLIGSDIEHYIRKLLFQGEIKYNMDARVLNFSMGKPRVGFSYEGQVPDAY